MIIKVKLDEQVYEVEIEDLRERPIKAIVDGDEFEIWPEGEPAVQARQQTIPTESSAQPVRSEDPRHQHIPAATPKPSIEDGGETPAPSASGALTIVRAPIPGVITAINTQPGAEVTIGQQLCVLEAMKMNNSIRASRAGRIAAVHVAVGQHVKHHDILLEYSD